MIMGSSWWGMGRIPSRDVEVSWNSLRTQGPSFKQQLGAPSPRTVPHPPHLLGCFPPPHTPHPLLPLVSPSKRGRGRCTECLPWRGSRLRLQTRLCSVLTAVSTMAVKGPGSSATAPRQPQPAPTSHHRPHGEQSTTAPSSGLSAVPEARSPQRSGRAGLEHALTEDPPVSAELLRMRPAPPGSPEPALHPAHQCPELVPACPRALPAAALHGLWAPRLPLRATPQGTWLPPRPRPSPEQPSAWPQPSPDPQAQTPGPPRSARVGQDGLASGAWSVERGAWPPGHTRRREG
uniref:Uncharacterized protein n=1 Tax=Myotis myotis TaxID=51298 RepID=A0A7J7QVG9_MYOMY|nr:hypothetical protein mMyoMyo1_011553 [Myotis myotis]